MVDGKTLRLYIKARKLSSTFSQKPGTPYHFVKFRQKEHTPCVPVLELLGG